VEIFIIAYARTIDYLKVFGIYGGCCEVLVDERANSDSSDDDVASMRVTIFLTLDRAGRVKAEVMIILLLFLQKQNLAFAVYLFGSVLSSKRLFRGPSTNDMKK